MAIPLFISGCSCSNKFDINTYETAVKNYNNSTGFEYKLIVKIKQKDENKYTKKESLNKFVLTTTGEVYDFSSEMKTYEIPISSKGVEGDPQLKYTYNRYYVGDEGNFYTKEKVGTRKPTTAKETISYEEKYNDLNDEYSVANLVPVFTKDQIINFSISPIKDQKGYSVATFTSMVPSFITNEDVMVNYEVKMDKNLYFSTINFTVEEENKTTTFEYSFYNFNSEVYISFPGDLGAY
jgi:hypothetical protein